MGLAEIDHHPVVNEPDRGTLYTSIYMCIYTPSCLANKVHYDIRMYFLRRGMENMHQMTRSNFALQCQMSYHAVAILNIGLCRGE
jgi:hypothetical protein